MVTMKCRLVYVAKGGFYLIRFASTCRFDLMVARIFPLVDGGRVLHNFGMDYLSDLWQQYIRPISLWDQNSAREGGNFVVGN